MFNFISRIMLCLLFVPIACVHARQDVLHIHSYDTQYIWEQQLTEGFDNYFAQSEGIHIYDEYMDAKRFPEPDHQNYFYQYLLQKYKHIDISVVVVSDDPALDLLLKHSQDQFHKSPIVFMGINRAPDKVLRKENMTGIFETRDFSSTLRGLKQVFNSDKLVIVSDPTATGRALQASINYALRQPGVPTQVQVLNLLKKSDIKATFRDIAGDTPVLIAGQLFDDQGHDALLAWSKGAQTLAQQIENPLISIGPASLDDVLATHELDAYLHGQQAASMVNKILAGVWAGGIKPITETTLRWRFSQEQMQRYNIKPNRLPEASTIISSGTNWTEKAWWQPLAIVLLILLSMACYRYRSKSTKVSASQA